MVPDYFYYYLFYIYVKFYYFCNEKENNTGTFGAVREG